MPPCGELEEADSWFWRTVTSAISRSVQVSTTDLPRASSGSRRCWRRVAICMVVISPMLQGCTSRNLPVSDHFDGSRFHNRAAGSDYSLWQEVKIGWELRTKRKNWPARFEVTPYRAHLDQPQSLRSSGSPIASRAVRSTANRTADSSGRPRRWPAPEERRLFIVCGTGLERIRHSQGRTGTFSRSHPHIPEGDLGHERNIVGLVPDRFAGRQNIFR